MRDFGEHCASMQLLNPCRHDEEMQTIWHIAKRLLSLEKTEVQLWFSVHVDIQHISRCRSVRQSSTLAFCQFNAHSHFFVFVPLWICLEERDLHNFDFALRVWNRHLCVSLGSEKHYSNRIWLAGNCLHMLWKRNLSYFFNTAERYVYIFSVLLQLCHQLPLFGLTRLNRLWCHASRCSFTGLLWWKENYWIWNQIRQGMNIWCLWLLVSFVVYLFFQFFSL